MRWRFLRYHLPRQPTHTRRGVLSTYNLAVAVIVTAVIALTVFLAFPIPNANTRMSYLLGHASTSSWVANNAGWLWPNHPVWGTIDDLEEVRRGKWPGLFAVPTLRAPTRGEAVDTPALLMLHILSMVSTSSRRRRELIRAHTPMMSVPEEYRHLVEIKFVLGRPFVDDSLTKEEKREIVTELEATEREQQECGDLVWLEDLQHGENMNDGKTLAWVRWVGRAGGREAQWVMKCDDDTFPLLPNLLDVLVDLDPAQPTYIGTALGRHIGYAFYYEGMLYGFNWGVVKSLAEADLPESILHRHWDEDAYTGLLMYNLPSKPGIAPAQEAHLRRVDPSNGTPALPISPDPRTGLTRVDLGARAGSFDRWWIADAETAIAWHNLKTPESWLAAHNLAWKQHQAKGHNFIWHPPESFEAYADTRQDAQ